MTIGYLRRCRKLRMENWEIKSTNFDLGKHILVFNVKYHWNLLEKFQILKLRWVHWEVNLVATSLLGKIQAGEETNTAENQGTTHLPRYFGQPSTCTKPICRDKLNNSYNLISSKGTCLELWNPCHWWNQYGPKRGTITCWWQRNIERVQI